jgi:hypothetical protein
MSGCALRRDARLLFRRWECYHVTDPICVEIGGHPLPSGTDCNPNPCPQTPTGACCLETGACRIETGPACAYLAGVFLEGLTECAPNPCYGACCYYNGECQMQALYWCEPIAGAEFVEAAFHASVVLLASVNGLPLGSSPRSEHRVSQRYRPADHASGPIR